MIGYISLRVRVTIYYRMFHYTFRRYLWSDCEVTLPSLPDVIILTFFTFISFPQLPVSSFSFRKTEPPLWGVKTWNIKSPQAFSRKLLWKNTDNNCLYCWTRVYVHTRLQYRSRVNRRVFILSPVFIMLKNFTRLRVHFVPTPFFFQYLIFFVIFVPFVSLGYETNLME